jgi:hypothetical protein
MFFYAKEIDVFEYFGSQPDYIQLQGPIFKDLDHYRSPQIEELFDTLIFSEISCNIKINCADVHSTDKQVPSFMGEGSTHTNGTHISVEGFFPRDIWKQLVAELKVQSNFELKINFKNVSGRVLERSDDRFTKFKIGIDLDFFKWSKRIINGN